MSKKRIFGSTRKSDVPYDPNDRDAVLSFWMLMFSLGTVRKGVDGRLG